MTASTILKNRLLWKIAGAIAIGLLILFVGPLVTIAGFRPLGNFWLALLLALLPLVLVLLFWWLERRRAAKRNAALVADLSGGATATEAREMEAKLGEALSRLRTLKLGQRGAYLYQLPWYAIIGPSKAGKTTALLNSGLRFPTAVEGEYRALRGQPNTPNCEWWFTDEAVLIDTAGRFIAQDENAQADAQGWKNFLGLLKRHRPLQPLNGIIVAVPAPDLSDPALLDLHLTNIRARLWEISEQLGQNLPIYVMITKADLIYGFREFFGRSNESESEQVLGSTAPDAAAQPLAATAMIKSGFDAMIENLSGRVPDRMQLEPNLADRARIAAFPQELATLRRALAQLLERIVESSRFEKPPRVRGVFLTSGTQTGSPIDRVLMIAGAALPGSDRMVGAGRSYFLRRLFCDLIIPEAGLAGENPAAEKRQRTLYVGSLIAAGVLFAVTLGIWTASYFSNLSLIEKVDQVVAEYREQDRNAGAADSPGQLGPLTVLSDATTRFRNAGHFSLGLGQSDRLAAGMRGIYHHDLTRRLTPLLVSLAERRMAADQSNPGALYNDLKSYRILGGDGGEGQAPYLATWAQTAWDAANGSSGGGSSAIAGHTTELVNAGLNSVAINTGLRDATIRVLGETSSPAIRIYARLKSEALAKGDEAWTARAHAGPLPDAFFDPGGAFAPGAGLPYFFTRRGYDTRFLPTLAQGTGMLKEEGWVIGKHDAGTVSEAQLPALRRDLEQLYFGELTTLWKSYIDGMKPRAVRGLDDNRARLTAAGGPSSPIPLLLRAIVDATDFSQQNKAAASAIGSALPSSLQTLGRAVSGSGVMAAGDSKANVVAQFQLLRQYVGTPAEVASSQMTATLTGMRQLADKLAVVQAAQQGGTIDQGATPTIDARAQITQLQGGISTMPAPMASIVQQVGADTSHLLGAAGGAALNGAIQQSFGAACAAKLQGKFPINPTTSADMALADFGQFFAPNQGSFAKFQAQASTMIDRNGVQWKPAQAGDGAALSQRDVSALQTADALSRTFFAIDPSRPQMSYTIEPLKLTGAKQVTLRLHGQTSTMSGTVMGPTTFDWPGTDGGSLEFERDGIPPVQKTWPGPWAVFRMMREASLRGGEMSQTAEGHLDLGGASLTFRVRTNGLNPLGGGLFARAACLSEKSPAI